MAKTKFSKKGKKGKVLRSPQEKKAASSHKGEKNQKWKEEAMERAFQLWDENDSLPPGKKWSMRAIAKHVQVPKTTIIERLSQRRKGKGHIAGGARQPRVLSPGKSSGSPSGSF